MFSANRWIQILFIGIVCIIDTPPGASSTDIIIDLNRPSGVARGQGSGFLHSLTGTEPPDQFVDPLKIKFWRGACLLDDGLYKRLKRSNATIQYVLSDGFQHPPIDGDCQKQEDVAGRWPHRLPELWQKHIEYDARRIIAKGWEVVWEPWNEPDFWEDGRDDDIAYQQYLDAFLIAYKTIRKLDPKARFSGPSLSAHAGIGWKMSRRRIEKFLDFCASNHLEVSDLTWHGFDDKVQSEYSNRVQEIKNLAATRYPSVNVQRVLISEIVSEAYFTSPGDLIATLKYLDDAGAEFTGRACWDGCWWPTLDGSVGKDVQGVFKPTPMWWANYWYGSREGIRYSGQTNTRGIAAFATMEKNSIYVLLGFSAAAGPSTPQKVTIHLHNIDQNETSATYMEQIPDLGSNFLTSPIKVQDYSVKRRDKFLELSIPEMEQRSAYLIKIGL